MLPSRFQNTPVVQKSYLSEPSIYSHTLRHRKPKGRQHGDVWKAAEYGDVRGTYNELASGVHVDTTDSHGNTPLIIASLYGRPEAVKILLAAKAEINLEGRIHGNALKAAAANGHEEAVRILLNHGDDTYSCGGVTTHALRIACRQGHEAVVKVLIDFGTDINLDNSREQSSLQIAAREGHVAIVKLLLQKGAYSYSSNNIPSALGIAAREGYEAIARIILDPEINTRARDERIGPAILIAAERKHKSIVDFLLGQNFHLKAPIEDIVPILIAAAESGFERTVTRLLARGVRIAGCTEGRYMIAEAARAGHEAIAFALLECETEGESPSDYESVLVAAAAGGCQKIVLNLLSRGTNANARDCFERNALSSAASYGHVIIVGILLAHDADPNAQGHCCGNALKGAVEGGHDSIFTLLLLHGADVDAECTFCGNTLKKAMLSGHAKVIKALLDQGAVKEPYLTTRLRGSISDRFEQDVTLLSLERQKSLVGRTELSEINIEDDSCSESDVGDSLAHEHYEDLIFQVEV